MTALLSRFAVEAWLIFSSMAPYLLLGFLVASVLSVLVKPGFVRAHLGRGGLGQIIKASILGVPLPLCSCGVLPVAASLRTHGASRGATLSFLTSTPQTGVDSIMITLGLLGPVFTFVRVAVAFVSGVVCGCLTELLVRDDDRAGTQDAGDEDECSPEEAADWRGKTVHGLRHGFVTVARSIARATLVGVLIGAALTSFIPESLFAQVAGNSWVSMGIMIAVGIPLYVCSSGSVPLAFAFISMGISPGAALVFLIVGPATNMAAVATVWQQLGGRSVSIYLASLALCAVAAGVGFDSLLGVGTDASSHMAHSELHVTLFHHIAAVVLLAVFAPALKPRAKARKVTCKA